MHTYASNCKNPYIAVETRAALIYISLYIYLYNYIYIYVHSSIYMSPFEQWTLTRKLLVSF